LASDAIPLTPLLLDNAESPRPLGGIDRATVLAELGVTPAEASLFHVIHYGMNFPPDELPGWAATDCYSLGGLSTPADCRAALTDCLRKGWLQVIDESALTKIADDIRAGGILGPIYGFPAVGEVDFTWSGAELWQKISDRFWADEGRIPFTYRDVVHEMSA
jgi:hypothetical protein